MADPVDHNQAEPSDISIALDVEQLDLNLYRSKNLQLPYAARGAFGGQVISQALAAATKCVKPEFLLHSLHAYFILSASVSVPLLFYVDRLRDGQSYSTRSVRAIQNGRTVFVMLCSFQIPEIWQLSRHWPMPKVPPPEDCEDEVIYYKRIASQPNVTEEFRERILGYAKSREESPVSIRSAGVITNEAEGRTTYMHWMKAKTAKQYPAAFQKCILAYITDLHLYSTRLFPLLFSLIESLQAMGSGHYSGPEAKSKTWAQEPGYSSLDHSLFFYNNEFDCSDWLLYVKTSPAAGMGRGVSSGLLYSVDGTLVATVTQEGVLRADIRRPSEETPQVKAKM